MFKIHRDTGVMSTKSTSLDRDTLELLDLIYILKRNKSSQLNRVHSKSSTGPEGKDILDYYITAYLENMDHITVTAAYPNDPDVALSPGDLELTLYAHVFSCRLESDECPELRAELFNEAVSMLEADKIETELSNKAKKAEILKFTRRLVPGYGAIKKQKKQEEAEAKDKKPAASNRIKRRITFNSNNI